MLQEMVGQGEDDEVSGFGWQSGSVGTKFSGEQQWGCSLPAGLSSAAPTMCFLRFILHHCRMLLVMA